MRRSACDTASYRLAGSKTVLVPLKEAAASALQTLGVVQLGRAWCAGTSRAAHEHEQLAKSIQISFSAVSKVQIFMAFIRFQVVVSPFLVILPSMLI